MRDGDRASEAPIEDRLVGTYRLVSFENVADDGEVRQPLGPDPKGVIMYAPERYMTAVLMRSDRPNFVDGDILGGSVDERAEAFATASAYGGRWTVQGDQIVHHLEVATFPNWAGSEQRRYFELDGDELRLFPPRLLMEGKMRTSRVVFRRVTR